MSTAKAIAKRLKNKGLQRLRWYCEMCKKQCRDENGFKNHCNTEGHLREMEKYSESADTYLEKFSSGFEKSYLDVLSHHHHTKRVNANFVYNELIQDRNHVHMNATKWDSLASFVRYLGETGKCEVDETEKGWFVKWIDPEEKARENARKKRDEADAKHQELRAQYVLRRQQEVDKALAATDDQAIQDSLDDMPIETEMVVSAPSKKMKMTGPSSVFGTSSSENRDEVDASALPLQDNVEDVHANDEVPSWLLPEIIVKINSSKVGSGLKNEKAVVLDVNNDHADLILLRNGQEVTGVPSKRLETVIPQKSGRVMVLGLHRLKGQKGTVEDIKVTECRATVHLDSGQDLEFEFEDISKLFVEE